MIKAFVFALAIAVHTGAAFGAENLEPLTIVAGEARHDFSVEVARTPDQKRTGLMFRGEMAADHGMLFPYDGEAVRTMWMRNTVLPLDMLFIGADGGIVSIAEDTVPFSEDIVSSRVPAKAVLELNAGTVDALGLGVGDRVEHETFTR